MVVISLLFALLTIRQFASVEQEVRFWSSFVLISHLVGFTLGLKPMVSATLLISFLGYRFIHGERGTLQSIRKQCIWALPFLLTASMPARFLDAGSYYDQSVRWFIQGIPAGLANLDLFLIQASAAHSFEALLTSLWGSWAGSSWTAIISTYLITRLLMAIRVSHPLHLVLPVLFLFVFVHFAQTSSPDLLGVALFLPVLWPSHPLKNTTLFLLLIALVLIKATLLPLALLLALRLARSQTKAWLSVALGTTLVLAKWVWTAGWLPIIGRLSPLPWAIPTQWSALLEGAYSPQRIGPIGLFVFGNLRLSELVFFLFLMSLIIALRRQMHKGEIAILGIGVVYGLWIMPQARLFLPLLVYLGALALIYTGNRPCRLIPGKRTYLLPLAATLMVVLPIGQWLPNGRLKDFYDFGGYANIHWMTPCPNWVIHTEAQTKKGPEGSFNYHRPLDHPQCFDAAFPCVPDRFPLMTGNPSPDEWYWSNKGYFYRTAPEELE